MLHLLQVQMTYTEKMCYKGQTFSQRLFWQGERHWELSCSMFIFLISVFKDFLKGVDALVTSASSIYKTFYMSPPTDHEYLLHSSFQRYLFNHINYLNIYFR